MGSRKRGRQQVAVEDGLITIKLANSSSRGQQSNLSAKATILRSCSSCAGGLPADAQEWDISQLRVEGEPVQRSTVVAFLNCCYSRIMDSEYEKQQQDPRTKASSLAQLLAFADAVGATRGVLAACLSQLDNLMIEVDLQTQQEDNTVTEKVVLETDGSGYFFTDDPESESDDPVQLLLKRVSPIFDAWVFDEDTFSTEEQAQAFRKAAAEQVEPLLHQAHALRLESLVTRLHRFIAACCAATGPDTSSGGILYGVLGSVFTDRVMDSVLPHDAGEAARMDFLEQALTWRCSAVDAESMHQLVEPDSDTEADVLCFRARLARDFMGSKQGQRVTVEIDLLDKGTIRIGEATLPAQLLVGRAVAMPEDYRLLMTGKEAEEGSEEGDE